MKKLTTRKLTLLALFTALVYVSTRFFQIQIPTPFGNTMFHLGNVLCVLSGLILGPVYGGIAAGLGSALFDLFDPIYLVYAPFTFAFKFLMAFVAGKVYEKNRDFETKNILKAIFFGQLTYTILYIIQNFVKSYFIMGLTLEAAISELGIKGGVSVTNGIISIIIATLLAKPLLKASLNEY